LNRNHFSLAIKVLLATSVVILLLNFVCANGGGVQLLALFGQIPAEQTAERENIYRSVDLMQWMIKVVALIGLCGFIYCLVSGWKKMKRNS